MQVDEAFDCREQTISQSAFVRAAGAGRNQINITFAHGRAVFGESDAPLRALAFGKAFTGGVGKTFFFKQGNDGVSRQSLHQIITQTAFVLPVLGVFGFLVDECDGHARHQHRFAAQQMRQLGHR